MTSQKKHITSAVPSEEGRVAASRLENVPIELVKEIVRHLVNGDESPTELAEIFRSFNALAQTAKLGKEAAMGVVGYVMSLASVRAVPTKTFLQWLPRKGFQDALVKTVEKGKSSALMPRIADLAAEPTASDVVDALFWKLVASLRSATVKGEPMYSGDEEQIRALADEILRRMVPPNFFKPVREAIAKDFPKGGFVKGFVTHFLKLPVDQRLHHALAYGPMCLWDVSQIEDFSGPCGAGTFGTFSSDLYWDTSSALSMSMTFANNTEFRGDLSTWDVCKVRTTDSMFFNSGIVNSGIGRWNFRELQSAKSMFAAAKNISSELSFSRWNLEKCTDLSLMFAESSVTDNDIGEWKLLKEAITAGMLPASFRGRLHKWTTEQLDATGALPAMPSFGTTAQSEEEIVTRLIADAVNQRDQGGGCSVQ